VQEVAGTLLYDARTVDSTIFPALSTIAAKQAKPMEKTRATIKQLIDYCATQEEAVLTYKASKMILAIHSNAGYCIKKKLQSQTGDISSYPTMTISLQQWCISYHCNNNLSGNVISSGSRVRSNVFNHKRGGIFTTNTHQDGPLANTNPNPNCQLDGGGSN
jgi:hypothetical protein